ncbi:AraC family transcriptional regulator [Streptomyces sp. NPDC048717]|uniref:AraC family transcriptional regulator n=1 Tax=Streptomyces sp. NPDC048717 TaxID=3154928 RepID=UPI00343CDB42
MSDAPAHGAGTGGPVPIYEGGDIEELCRIVGGRLSPHRLTVLGEQRLPGRFRAFHEGPVGLYDLAYGTPVRLLVRELPDFYNVILPQAGGGTVTVNGTALASPLSVAGPGDVVSMQWDPRAVNGALALSRRLVDDVLTVRLGDVPTRPLRFHRHQLDPADPAVRSWLALVHAFRLFVASPLAHHSDLGVRHFERLLADTLLDVQPHSWSGAAAGVSAGAQAGGGATAMLPSALRRAMTYCAEHADEAVSVSDIARAARVGVRTLREGFRTHLDTTPLAYLRRVRLDRVHHELTAIAEGRATGSVTEVACRWGFTHLGRFSAEYRRAYGRLPSDTSRGRPRLSTNGPGSGP